MKPEHPYFPPSQCLPGQCQYGLSPSFCDSTAPRASSCWIRQGRRERQQHSLQKFKGTRVLATLCSSLPKPGREEFLLFLRLTSCHVLAALSTLYDLLCLGLLTMPVVFWPCFSLMVLYKLLRVDQILTSMKTSGHSRQVCHSGCYEGIPKGLSHSLFPFLCHQPRPRKQSLHAHTQASAVC